MDYDPDEIESPWISDAAVVVFCVGMVVLILLALYGVGRLA